MWLVTWLGWDSELGESTNSVIDDLVTGIIRLSLAQRPVAIFNTFGRQYFEIDR